MSRQFNEFKATELYCAKCGVSQPVRERPADVPGGNVTELLCVRCATVVGLHTVVDNSLGGKLSKLVGKLLKK